MQKPENELAQAEIDARAEEENATQLAMEVVSGDDGEDAQGRSSFSSAVVRKTTRANRKGAKSRRTGFASHARLPKASPARRAALAAPFGETQVQPAMAFQDQDSGVCFEVRASLCQDQCRGDSGSEDLIARI